MGDITWVLLGKKMPSEKKIWSPSLSEEWYKELDTLFLSNGTSFLPSGKRQGRHKQTMEIYPTRDSSLLF